ncbi:arylamine N-acetyltransferase family protein [Microbispora sp. ATCC PTA-5024]|uniref:arylamine N-acetyltransferase family protein n=1 Tax=Microbispora sp. ATCC PTA-5024 TaxID=316330 RepID=UPI000567904E|nr:arylamine N-acetyltransferase [Microbispora sp. ATCC PTA-5024]
MSGIRVDDYLRRLGLRNGGHPSVEGLFRLQAAHVERVPYENLEIWLGRPTTIDPADSWRRIMRGRGGYCCHLNGAFSLLLSRLGYRVTRHFAGVQGTPDAPAGATGNHLALTVRGLSSQDNPGGVWFVDTGLGDGIHEPLPLVAGEYEQGPFRYRLRPSEAEPGGWRFDHDPRCSFTGMDLRAGPSEMAAFQATHEHLSTSPDSGFVRVLAVQRRDAAGVDLLTGLVLKRVGSVPPASSPGPVSEDSTTLERQEDYFAALADVFGLTLDDVPPPERAGLWERLAAAHERWLAERPATA